MLQRGWKCDKQKRGLVWGCTLFSSRIDTKFAVKRVKRFHEKSRELAVSIELHLSLQWTISPAVQHAVVQFSNGNYRTFNVYTETTERLRFPLKRHFSSSQVTAFLFRNIEHVLSIFSGKWSPSPVFGNFQHSWIIHTVNFPNPYGPP